MQVDLDPDLTLTVGDAATRLTPGSAFRLAEKLIRGATRQMIEDECSAAEGHPPRLPDIRGRQFPVVRLSQSARICDGDRT
jgi:hypothetical protein